MTMAKVSPRIKKKVRVRRLATMAPDVRTVVYIHGIGNKPKSSEGRRARALREGWACRTSAIARIIREPAFCLASTAVAAL